VVKLTTLSAAVAPCVLASARIVATKDSSWVCSGSPAAAAGFVSDITLPNELPFQYDKISICKLLSNSTAVQIRSRSYENALPMRFANDFPSATILEKPLSHLENLGCHDA
jgi:hypothetical protein